MQIVHFVDSTDLRDGGVPRFVLDAARVMAQSGHASTVLTLNTTDAPHAWLSNRMGQGNHLPVNSRLPLVRQLDRSRLGSKVLNADAMREVRATLQNADVVHLHCVWSIANLQIAAACRAMGVPYVLTTHGMLDDWSMAQGELKKKIYMRLGGRTMLKRAARVHCTATAEVEQSRKWFPKGREFIAPYLMDLSEFRDLPGLEPAQRELPCVREAKAAGLPVILFLSRLHVKKGIESLIRAAAQLRDAGTNACFVLAGTGDERYVESLKQLTRTLNLTDRVHFVGMVKGATKVSLYQNADLFVLPTSQENFGLVLTEAMACGTPVLTTRGTDIWRDIEASGGGCITQQDPADIAGNITRMLRDPVALARMGHIARNWVFASFSESTLTPRYIQLYETALGQHSQLEAKPLRMPALQRLQSVAATL